MIFQTDNAIQKIIDGSKTQTRRLVSANELLWYSELFEPRGVVGNSATGRVRYRVGQDYAVQPGRGKPGVWWHPFDTSWPAITLHTREEIDDCRAGGWQPLRIRILLIRREDVRTISEADARAEGYASPYEFLMTWSLMHDKRNHGPASNWLDSIDNRPASRFNAWALTFEVALNDADASLRVVQ